MSATGLAPAYIIAARRTALGRIGGLHRSRRLEDLAAPVIRACLEDAKVPAAVVEEFILGNATAGGNPARIISLASGLPETATASTIDRQCASGLEAILAGARLVAGGDARVVVAGGAESLSTAPWRIAKPRSLYQLPQFIGLEAGLASAGDDPERFGADEALARRLGISRRRQDEYALESRRKALRAREERRFVGEIVLLRSNADEARDESVMETDLDELAQEVPYLTDSATITPGNTSAFHDGAAFAVVVAEPVWRELGKPAGLRLVAAASQGVSPDDAAAAPIAAMEKLYSKLNGFNRSELKVIETSESSAAQALALIGQLRLDPDQVNPDGGALARGHPFGASGAVIVVRLFTRLARQSEARGRAYGAAVQGAAGGLGVAALFEAV
jgi:acetyl-CoA C-acetyltransferase